MTAFVKVMLSHGEFVAIGLRFIRTIEPLDKRAKITLDDGRQLMSRAPFQKVVDAIERLAKEDRAGIQDNSLFGQVFGPSWSRRA